MTQNERLLNLLRANPQGITPLDALEHAHSLRLAARVWELRNGGHRIVTDRMANGVARYRLIEEAAA